MDTDKWAPIGGGVYRLRKEREMNTEVWVLFGLYYIEDHYECEDVISIHAESNTAHEHKKFLESCSNSYYGYILRHFELLKKKKD